MGKYNGAVITTAGANVISQAISGSELTWTVMRSSSVAIPEGTDIAALTSLTGIEQTAAITDASVYGNSTIQVSARFSNTGVSTAYLLETIGIYGQLAGGAETLIAVMTAVTPDQMPVYDADSPSAFIYNSQITVQGAETVVMTVNDTGTATVADLNRKVDLNGGDLSNTVVDTFTAATAEYPVPTVGDTGATLWGKVVKFFSDIRSAVNSKIDSSKITTSLGVTTTGSVADATVSKVLNDKITTLNDSVSSLGTYVTFTPTFVSSITDIFVRTAKGFYNPITKMCFLTIFIISKNGLIPVTNDTICTIPSTYTPSENIQFPAFLVPKSSTEDFSDVQIEACAITTQGVIRLGNSVHPPTNAKLFAINVTYFCR